MSLVEVGLVGNVTPIKVQFAENMELPPLPSTCPQDCIGVGHADSCMWYIILLCFKQQALIFSSLYIGG